MTKEEACGRFHQIALREVGIHAIPGPEANMRIVEYAKHTSLKATSDEVPWCSSFVNYVVDSAGFGFRGTNSAAARSRLNWGVGLRNPIVGCIVVLDRHDDYNPNAAHVTICDHHDISNGIIRCIGGNQENSVKVSRYSTDKVLAYRVPRLEEI